MCESAEIKYSISTPNQTEINVCLISYILDFRFPRKEPKSLVALYRAMLKSVDFHIGYVWLWAMK